MRAVSWILILLIAVSMISAQKTYYCIGECGDGECRNCEKGKEIIDCNSDGTCEFVGESDYCKADCCGDNICELIEMLRDHPKVGATFYCEEDCSGNANYPGFPALPNTSMIINTDETEIDTEFAAFLNMTEPGVYEGYNSTYIFYEHLVNITRDVNNHQIVYPPLNAEDGTLLGNRTIIINPAGEIYEYEFNLSKLIISELERGYVLSNDWMSRRGNADILIYEDRLIKRYLLDDDSVEFKWFTDGVVESITGNESVIYNLTFNGSYEESISLPGQEPAKVDPLDVAGTDSGEQQASSGSGGSDGKPLTAKSSGGKSSGDRSSKHWLVENLDKWTSQANEYDDVTKLLTHVPAFGDTNDRWKNLVNDWFEDTYLGGNQQWVNTICRNGRQLEPRYYNSPITWTQEQKMSAMIQASYDEEYTITWEIDNGLVQDLDYTIMLGTEVVEEGVVASYRKESKEVQYTTSSNHEIVSIVFKNHQLSDGSNELQNLVSR